MGLLDNIKDAVGMGDEESKPADAQAEREQAVADAQQRAEAAQAAQAEQPLQPLQHPSLRHTPWSAATP